MATTDFGFGIAYYDKILVAIATSIGGGAILGLVTDLSYRLAILAGALFATIFIYDAMFRKPPVSEEAASVRNAAIIWHAFLAILVAANVL